MSGVLPSGTVIEGFRLERCIGQGSMGVVYAATQRSLSRPAAVKVFDPTAARADEVADLAAAQAALDHQHIVPIYAAGSSPHGPYLAMKLIEGPSLAALLRDGIAPD